MAKKTKQKKELTTTDVFLAIENAIPNGATNSQVLEAAATLIVTTMTSMHGTKQDFHDVMNHLEEYALKCIEESQNATD